MVVRVFLVVVAAAALAGAAASLGGCAAHGVETTLNEEGIVNLRSLHNQANLGVDVWNFNETGRRSATLFQKDQAMVSGPDSVAGMDLEAGRLAFTTDVTAKVLRIYGKPVKLESGEVVTPLLMDSEDFSSSASETTRAEAARLAELKALYLSYDERTRAEILAEIEKIKAATPAATSLIEMIKTVILGL
jgi:hypothetical protein